MHKELVTYIDFNKVEKQRTLYFNLTEAELVKMQKDSEQGIQFDMEEAVRSKDTKTLLDFIEMLVHKSYGLKNSDGEHFDKSPEIMARFENSAAYSPLYMSLFKDEGKKAIEFINSIMPPDLLKQAEAQMRGEAEAADRARVEQNYAPSAREVFEQQKAARVVDDQEPQVIVVPSSPTTPLPEDPDKAEFERWKAAKAAKAQQDAAGTL